MSAKQTKIIIIGFGSIGQRHYKNLLALGFKDVYVYDIDRGKISGSGLKTIDKLDKKNLEQFNAAFICNPNNKHISAALACARAGCHLFIEKPLSHNFRNINKLQNICRQKKLVTMVGCNMRFHPCLQFIKKYLKQKKLGQIYLIHLQTGLYLPFWRPEQDYRKNYAAKKVSGGGIILDGGVHNFDLLFWLNNFFPVQKYRLIYNKISNLEIETEDCFVASFNFKNKTQASIMGDYLQKPYSWTIKIVGAKGNIIWDFRDNSILLVDEKGKKILRQHNNYNTNKMYLDEIGYFMRQVEQKQKTFNNLEQAAKILRYLIKR